MMTRVLATGVFNILHPGHLLFLEEAKKLGDELVVIVSSDKIAKKSKGFVLPQEQRAKMVAALRPVDKVFVGDEKDTMKLLTSIRPDVIALGHDQEVDEKQLKCSLDRLGISARIVRVKAKMSGELYSSSSLLKKLH